MPNKTYPEKYQITFRYHRDQPWSDEQTIEAILQYSANFTAAEMKDFLNQLDEQRSTNVTLELRRISSNAHKKN